MRDAEIIEMNNLIEENLSFVRVEIFSSSEQFIFSFVEADLIFEQIDLTKIYLRQLQATKNVKLKKIIKY